MWSRPTLARFASQYTADHDLCHDYAKMLLARAECFEAWSGRPIRLARLRVAPLNRYLASLQATGLRPETVAGYRRCILTLWYAAADRGLCYPPVSRQVRRIARPAAVPPAWTLDEVRRLLRTAEATKGTTPDGISSARYWAAVIAAGYDTGLRRGDLLALQRQQVSEDGLVVCTQHKTGDRHCARLWPSTLRRIDATFPPARELLFPWSRNFNLWGPAFRRIAAAAGLVGTFKRLRRTSGSYVELHHPGAGGSHLGHRSPEVFGRYYADPRITLASPPRPPALE